MKSIIKPLTVFLRWWYRIAAPAEPLPEAPLAERETARRGRIGSIIILAIILIVLALMPVAAFGPNHALLPALAVGLAISLTALFFNSRGQTTIAGTLIVAQIILGETFSVVGAPGGLTMNTLPLFDQFIISELVAISFFSASSVFLVALTNSVLFYLILRFAHHDAQVGHLLVTQGYGLLLRPIILQVIVAVVPYLWVLSATNALARADHAEEIVALKQAVVEQQQDRQTALQNEINQIIMTHVAIANGDFSARVPLKEGNVLWSLAGSFNNLLIRVQGWRQSDEELSRTRRAAAQLIQDISASRLQGSDIPIYHSGTIIDAVALEVKYLPTSSTTHHPLHKGQQLTVFARRETYPFRRQ